MIREERSPAFWQGVADHPEVASRVFLGGQSHDLSAIVASPNVLPLASEHGGFLFARLDGFGRVYELHTMYRPEGWGREVLTASKLAFAKVFDLGAQLVSTYEVEGWWRSRPPKSFGFIRAGGFRPVPGIIPHLSTWVLTSDAWDASPARRRVKCQLSD